MQTVWSKNKGGGGNRTSRAAPLDPPLLKEARMEKLEEQRTDCQSNCFSKFILLFVKQHFVILSLESLSFTYTANGKRQI